MRIFDVEKISTHGGSVRIYGCKSNAIHDTLPSVQQAIDEEAKKGLLDLNIYSKFQDRAEKIKLDFSNFLLKAKLQNKKVCGYGAAAKGNTLINFAGVKQDLLPFVADAAAAKIGKFLPGSRIPIVDPNVLIEYRPDYVVILPWNIASEVKEILSDSVGFDCEYVTFIPELREI